MSTLSAIEKLPTGISGFDLITAGGLPKQRTTLLAGTAGSGKTVMAAQFLAEGIRQFGEPGVFVTFEETPQDIRQNLLSLNWQIDAWEAQNQWVFVDASPTYNGEMVAGNYDLDAFLARIAHAVQKVKARRVAMDSLGAIFFRLPNPLTIRAELLRIAVSLKQMGVTAVMTAERDEEYGTITRHHIEEFVADNVIILRNVLEEEKRRRTIEILKFRGAFHQKGEYPFAIIPNQGVVVIPLSAIELKQRSSNKRVSSGNNLLDIMCNGGFFRDSVILVSGATGTGKTLMVTEFAARNIGPEERCLLFAFEESREQIFRNASGWGIDFEQMEAEGKLKVVCEYPEVTNLETRLIEMKTLIQQFKPTRVAVDSLSALERVGTMRSFREFVISLTSYIKHQEITGLFTSTTPNLMGNTSITEAHISTLTDSIILLRYVEMNGEMRRGITVLKMRGSQHDKEIREFTIDHQGMHIGSPFRNVVGILSGHPSHANLNDSELPFA